MLSFADAVGNIFNRLGKLGALVENVRSHQTTQLTALTDTTSGVVAQFDAESDIQALIGSAYISILGGVEGACSLAQNVAAQTLNRMVFRDNPRISQNLQTLNTVDSIYEVIRQMKIMGATVRAQTITATPNVVNTPGPHFSGTGTGIIVTSTRRPIDGAVLENAFAETVLFTCTQDSYDGGATAGNEQFTVTGQGSTSDVFAFNWPLGSNGQTSLNAIDGNVSNGSGNLLTNSGFSDWTNDVPDNWTLVVGTATTNFVRETTIVYDGTSSAIRLVGDAGGTLVEFYQEFNDSEDGSSDELEPLTQYACNLFVRRDGVAAGAGVLTVDLVDSANDVIEDEGGTQNSFTIDLTSLTTVYTSYSGTFRTPLILPSVVRIRFRLSTALTNTRSVYLDKMAFGEMTQLTTNCCFYAVFSGDEDFSQGSYGTVAVTNSRGAGGALGTFQTLLYQLLPDFASNEFLLPSSTVPSIDDGLIN